MIALITMTALLLGAPSKGPAQPPGTVEVAVGEHVTVPLPAGLPYEVSALGEHATLLSAAAGAASLLVIVYDGRDAPGAWKALTVQTEELERKLSPEAVKKTRLSLLGAPRTARELAYRLDGAAHTARVVTAKRGPRTIVCVWTAPDAPPADAGVPSAEALATAVRGVVVR